MYLNFSLWLAALFFISFYSTAQVLPNSFKIGEYLEVLSGDSLKVYYTCSGSITKESCAEFYRVGKINRNQIGFDGLVKDYSISGEKAFEGVFQNGLLNGKATFYHENGSVSETGVYLDNMRNGVWKYFYPNGNLEKVINFIRQQPFVISYIDSNNVVKVVNGNGIYSGRYLYDQSCARNWITGELKDGRMHGEWAFGVGYGREFFENGQFIKGYTVANKNNPTHYSNYSDSPRMKLSGYYTTEYLWLGESDYCPFFKFGKGKPKRILINESNPYRYKKADFHNSFYPELQQNIEKELPQNLADQWLIIGLGIEKSGKLGPVNVYSSINDQALENKILAVLRRMDNWDAARINKAPFAEEHYFSLLVEAGKLQIPSLLRKEMLRRQFLEQPK